MLWGTFTAAHIISLIICLVVTLGLHFLLKLFSDKIKTAILFVLSFAGISAIIFNLVMWDSPIEYLPLHMCSVNALLLPFAVLTKNRVLGAVTLFWCLGAALALIVNTGQANFEIMSPTFLFFYIPHMLEVAVPVLLFTSGLIKFELKAVPLTIIITMLIYTAVHFANLFLNDYAADKGILDRAGNTVSVNYMYSLDPEGNPMLAFFWKLIPYPYWYMYAAIPLIAVYLGGIWGITRLASRCKGKKHNKAEI